MHFGKSCTIKQKALLYNFDGIYWPFILLVILVSFFQLFIIYFKNAKQKILSLYVYIENVQILCACVAKRELWNKQSEISFTKHLHYHV